jgi:hypothetical protein
MMKFKTKGWEQTVRPNIQRIAKNSPREFADATYEEYKIEFGESQKLVPVLTGELKGSGRIDPPVIQGKKISVRISYNTEYAIYVHEDLEAFHPNGGQAKYLEQPLRQSAPSMPGRIARRVDLNRAMR